MSTVNHNLHELFAHRVELPAGELVNRRALPAHGGVIALGDGEGRVIQLLASQNLRRTVTHRLSERAANTTSRRADLRGVVRRAWWLPAHSVFESTWRYWQLARRLFPGDYRDRLGFAPCAFASVTPDEHLPRWRITERPFAPGAVDIGPFARHAHAKRLIDTLEELFDLCRYHHVLDQTPHGAPCAYFDMGQCPAPCDGSIPLHEYRDMIRASARFARGQRDAVFDRMQHRMRELADARDYAAAARIKERVERARHVLTRAAPIAASPAQFRFFIVQQGPTRSMIKPFFVERGALSAGEAVAIKESADACKRWHDRVRENDNDGQAPGCAEHDDPLALGESMSLVAHFIAKGDKTPGLYLHARDVSPDNLHSLVAARFARARRGADNPRSNAPSIDLHS